MPSGKRLWGIGSGQPSLLSTVSPQKIIMTAAKTSTTVIAGEVGDLPTEMMLDSGSSVSLVKHELLGKIQDTVRIPSELKKQLQLVIASEEPLPICGHIQAPVTGPPVQVPPRHIPVHY